MDLQLLQDELAVCRLKAGDPVPGWAWRGEFVSISRGRAELSVICSATAVPVGVDNEPGWRALVVTTELDFATTGVAAAITTALADAGISVLPVATHATDYFLVRHDRVADAIGALLGAGHSVVA